jgi:hypothetical protein
MARKVRRQREIEEMMDDLDVEFTLQKTKGNHFRVTIIGPLGQRSVIFSCTGSDRRGDLNVQKYIKTALREVGHVNQ